MKAYSKLRPLIYTYIHKHFLCFNNVTVGDELRLEDTMQEYSQWQCTPRTARRT